MLKEQDRLRPEAARDGREKPVLRMHEQVFPDRGGHRGHHEEWRDHKDAQDTLALHRLIENPPQPQAALAVVQKESPAFAWFAIGAAVAGAAFALAAWVF